MSGVSIMGRQVGGACRAGRMIGLSHSGTRLVLPNPADNLIVNGGFERGIDGWTPPKSYRIAETGDDGYVTRAHGGDKWLWLCSSGISDVNGARQTIAVTPGMNYRLSFFRAEAIGYDNNRYAVANMYAVDGTKIAGLYMPPPPDSKWREYTLDFTAPADCTEATVMICGLKSREPTMPGKR